MRLIVSIALYSHYLIVDGSTGFGQCYGKKRAVSVFNWDSETSKADKQIYSPVVAFVPQGGTKWWTFTTNDYYDKMVLDTGSSKSSFHSPSKDSRFNHGVRIDLGGKE